MRPSLTNVLVGVALVCAGYYANREPGETVVINHTRIDTVAPAGMMKLLEDGALENTRLNRLLRGYQSRPPIQIIRTDTLVTPPDTVLQLVSVRGADLTVAPLIRADSGWAPEIHRFDVGGCDDGWSWKAGDLVCDRARLGHLSAAVAVGASYPFGGRASAGLEWTPAFRSGWRASIQTDPVGRLTAAVTRSLRIW